MQGSIYFCTMRSVCVWHTLSTTYCTVYITPQWYGIRTWEPLRRKHNHSGPELGPCLIQMNGLGDTHGGIKSWRHRWRSAIYFVQLQWWGQCCGSGSGMPDPFPFQPNEKLNYTFFRKISIYCPKYWKIMAQMTLTRKIQDWQIFHCKSCGIGSWIQIRIQIWIGIKGKVGSGSITALGEGKGDANLWLGLLVFISSCATLLPSPFFWLPPHPPTHVITPHLLWEERVLYTHRTSLTR
jgi:hypothetical protein